MISIIKPIIIFWITQEKKLPQYAINFKVHPVLELLRYGGRVCKIIYKAKMQKIQVC